MGKHSRRRYAAASTAIMVVSAPFVAALGDTAAAPTLDRSVGSSREAYQLPSSSKQQPLSTAFSCGHTWRAAQSCSRLCVNGDDSTCPDGQRCYAGTTCAGESSMDEVLERQSQLEQQEQNRLMDEREEECVERFVCGLTFAHAESSCGAPSSPLDADYVFRADGVAGANYCSSGSSSQCPMGEGCYAAVPCPRHSHLEEVSLIERVGLQLLNSIATEAVLLMTEDNSTGSSGRRGDGILIGEYGLMSEEWRAFFRESSSALSGKVSSLLSSRHGLN